MSFTPAARRLRREGDDHFDHGRWTQAVGAYELARTSGLSDPDLLLDLAVAYRNAGQPQRAVKLLERVRAEHPDGWQASVNLALIYAYDLRDADAAARNLAALPRGKNEPPQTALIEAQIRKLRSASKATGGD